MWSLLQAITSHQSNVLCVVLTSGHYFSLIERPMCGPYFRSLLLTNQTSLCVVLTSGHYFSLIKRPMCGPYFKPLLLTNQTSLCAVLTSSHYFSPIKRPYFNASPTRTASEAWERSPTSPLKQKGVPRLALTFTFI